MLGDDVFAVSVEGAALAATVAVAEVTSAFAMAQ